MKLTKHPRSTATDATSACRFLTLPLACLMAALLVTSACSEDAPAPADSGVVEWPDLGGDPTDSAQPDATDTTTVKPDVPPVDTTPPIDGDPIKPDIPVVPDVPDAEEVVDVPDTILPDGEDLDGEDMVQPAGSCAGKCGKYDGDASCQCDSGCKKFSDCCLDYEKLCTGPDEDITDTGPDIPDQPDIPKPPVTCTGMVGTLDPATPPGALVVSEVLINPKAVSDEFGEWFEIYNPGDKCVPLGGMVIADGAVDLHVVGGDTLFVPPKGVVVLGPNGDMTKNGNVKVDYVYNNFLLGNLSDSIIIKTNVGGVLDEVKWQFPVIDPAQKHFEWPMIDLDGKAANLSADNMEAKANDIWQSPLGVPVWCLAPTQWQSDPGTGQPSGDYGSPGKVNALCPKPPDGDKDGVPDDKDNCPTAENLDQADGDKDGVGDVCDNCPSVPNKAQENVADGPQTCFVPGFQNGKCDEAGDACDKQECGDGEPDTGEECDDGNTKNNDGCEACKSKPIVPAKVFITEILTSTQQVPQGRWIEIHSKDSEKISLTGWTIQTGTGGSHTIQGPLDIVQNQTLVFGDTKSQLFNGKVPVDYAWQTNNLVDIQLDPKGDTIELLHNGQLIDKVEYSVATPAMKTGISVQLDTKYYASDLNDKAEHWCYSTQPWIGVNNADLGSPGKLNVTCTPPDGDKDGDGVKNGVDNCVFDANPQQEDGDNDGVGDICDNCKLDFNPNQLDGDVDNVGNVCDNCAKFPNPDQADVNKNGFGDKCDSPTCGDGKLDLFEECDDGNKANCDGCTAVCHIEETKAGQLLITEIMVVPQKVGDVDGEWVEVFNPTATQLDLNGWTLKDKGFNTHLIASSDGKPVIVPAGGYAVLAANGDQLKNGGAEAVYAYGNNNFQLSNLVDSVILECNGKVIDEVSYWLKGALCDGPNNPPGCETNGFEACIGKSQNLEPSQTEKDKNDKPDAWCCAKGPFGLGDFGTPGKPNPSCVNPCVDPQTKDPKPDKTPCDPTGKLFWCIKGECVDQPKCGDGSVNQANEECDDGNNLNGDGCNSACKNEPKPQADGTLIISEVMVNPDANLSNSDIGEWFEVYNPTAKPIELLGWTIADEPRSCESNKSKKCNLDDDCKECELDGFSCKLDKDGNPVIKNDFGKCLVDAAIKADKYTFKASCGDGRTSGNEECDDGNGFAGDGCSAQCLVEGVCTSLKLNGTDANVGIVKLVGGKTKRLPFGSHLLVHGWFLLEAPATVGKCDDGGVSKPCSYLFSYGLADEYHIAVRSMDNKLQVEAGVGNTISVQDLGPVTLNKWTHVAVLVRRVYDPAKLKAATADPFRGRFVGFLNGTPSAEFFRADWPWSAINPDKTPTGVKKVTLGGQALGADLLGPMQGRVARFNVTTVPHLALAFGPQAVWGGSWKGGSFNGNIIQLPLDEGFGNSLSDKSNNDIIAGNSKGVWASAGNNNASGPYCTVGGKLLADTSPIHAGKDAFVVKPFSRAVIMTTYDKKHRNDIDGIATFGDDLSGGFFSLDNNPDSIVLINPANKEVDRFGYTSDQKWKWSVGVSAMLKPGGCHDVELNNGPDCWTVAATKCAYGYGVGDLVSNPSPCEKGGTCFSDNLCLSVESPPESCSKPFPPKTSTTLPSGMLGCCQLPDRGTPGAANICP